MTDREISERTPPKPAAPPRGQRLPGISCTRISVSGGAIEYRWQVRHKVSDTEELFLGRYHSYQEAAAVLTRYLETGERPPKQKTGPKPKQR